ncbi:MAG: exosortase K [Candidatus Azobacteroides sp.]|nr:exosortase K [Candidatus Azobacteroides sp.]
MAYSKKQTVNNKNIPYCLTAAGLFICLKLGYTLADQDDLVFLLKPIDQLVELVTDSPSVYLAETGYYHEKLNIVIDKSCSGFNFLILCFLSFIYLIIKYLNRPLHKITAFPIAFICAYALTLFVNTSRILASIIIQNQTKDLILSRQHLLHEAIGIITNLSFLVLAYYLIEKLLMQKFHAKPA